MPPRKHRAKCLDVAPTCRQALLSLQQHPGLKLSPTDLRTHPRGWWDPVPRQRSPGWPSHSPRARVVLGNMAAWQRVGGDVHLLWATKQIHLRALPDLITLCFPTSSLNLYFSESPTRSPRQGGQVLSGRGSTCDGAGHLHPAPAVNKYQSARVQYQYQKSWFQTKLSPFCTAECEHAP